MKSTSFGIGLPPGPVLPCALAPPVASNKAAQRTRKGVHMNFSSLEPLALSFCFCKADDEAAGSSAQETVWQFLRHAPLIATRPSFGDQRHLDGGEASRVATRPSHTHDVAGADRVNDQAEITGKRELAGDTTSTDPRSQRIRESRKGRPCNELGLPAYCLSAACAHNER